MKTTEEKINPQTALPEFVDCKGIRQYFQLSRSYAYFLAGQGSIKSFVLKKPGAVRGRRLFCSQSIRNFILSSQVSGGAS